MKRTTLSVLALALFASFAPLASTALAQGTAFTYQGQLNDGGSPASGTYDLRFAIYDSASAGGQLGNLLTNSATAISNGLFTVTLDFGNQFPGAPRWLEIGVRTNGAGSFFTLSPRQALTPAPYAITAGSVISGGLAAGSYGNAVTLNNAANQITGAFTGNGANVTNVNAATLGGLASSNLWQLGGNTVSPGQFLGSANNQPVAIRANNLQVMQLAYASNAVDGYSPNVIGGFSSNLVAAGVVGATIGGGGSAAAHNTVNADFGTVVGGLNSVASGKYAVAGGYYATAGGQYSVALGAQATATGNGSTAMGDGVASGNGSTAMGVADATGDFSTAMGYLSDASGPTSTAMGSNSVASGFSSTAFGNSSATNDFATAVGNSFAWGNYSTALGNAEASGDYSTAMGESVATGIGSTAMGYNASATGTAATAMGRNSTASGDYSFAAGWGAGAIHAGSFVWGDSLGNYFPSTATNQFLIRATGGVGIGLNNPSAALHVASPASLPEFQITQQNSSDSARLRMNVSGYNFWEMDVSSGASPQLQFWYAAAAGPRMIVDISGNVYAASFNTTSDRNLKENFSPAGARAVLDKVAALPISEWNFKQDPATRHIGPMAQDFYAAFNVGTDDKHIATVDEGGVALAAIQGLNQKLDEKDAEIQQLKQSVAQLQAIVSGLTKAQPK